MSARRRLVLALTPLAERAIEGTLFDGEDASLELLCSVGEADELLRTISEERPDAVLLSPGLAGSRPDTASASAPQACGSSASRSISATPTRSRPSALT
jgi:hypothetical protein